jgi:hypothetical protein
MKGGRNGGLRVSACGLRKGKKDLQDTVISSPGSMARYALIATETPAWEKRVNELRFLRQSMSGV